MPVGRLTPKQRLFYQALRELEEEGARFGLDDLVERTAWSSSTVKTYVGKKLLGRFVFRNEGTGRMQVRGIRSLSESHFAAVMTQKGSFDQIANQLDQLSDTEWEQAIEILVRAGRRRGFDTTPLLERLLDQVG